MDLIRKLIYVVVFVLSTYSFLVAFDKGFTDYVDNWKTYYTERPPFSLFFSEGKDKEDEGGAYQ